MKSDLINKLIAKKKTIEEYFDKGIISVDTYVQWINHIDSKLIRDGINVTGMSLKRV